MNRSLRWWSLLVLCAAGLTAAAAPETSSPQPPATVFKGTAKTALRAPLAGARVTILDEDRHPMGTSRSDAQGRFVVEAHARPGQFLYLDVEADDYDAWEWSFSLGDHPGLDATLRRHIGQKYLEALAANQDAQARQQGVRELLASALSGGERDYEIVFPFLGRLHDSLRHASQAKATGPDEERWRDQAFELLALWGEPSDAELLKPWLKTNSRFYLDQPEISGATLDEVCAAWRTAHFKSEKMPPPNTWNMFSPAAMDPKGERGLVTFEVRYAHWDYGMYLIVTHEGNVWKLAHVVDGWIT